MTTLPVTQTWNQTPSKAGEKCVETAMATHNILARFYLRLSLFWKKRQQQRIERDSFNTLLRLDERELADIGLKREDVLRVSKLPLSFNASDELRKSV
ncbi:MAG: DUF1127 domain-containing protein [Pseudomonadota bacterium]